MFEKEVRFDLYCPVCSKMKLDESSDTCNECITFGSNTDTHAPVNFDPIYKDYFPGDPKEVKKVSEYLYASSYPVIDYADARNYFMSARARMSNFSCSAIRKNNLIGRNFDWTYDESVSFVIKRPRSHNNFASIGIAGALKSLKKDFVESKKYSRHYRILPFCMLDGINENGVFIETNVVPSISALEKQFVEPAKNKTYVCSSQMLCRYVLDNAINAISICEHIRDHVAIYNPAKLYSMGYDVHFMIGDKNSTYELEFINGHTVIIDISDRPYVTNFHLCGIVPNEDGTVYTPETQDALHNAVKTNEIEPFGSGLERYNMIVNHYEQINSKQDLRQLLKDLYYTRTYLSSERPSDPYWYTEFSGILGCRCDNYPNEFEKVIAAADLSYINRTRTDSKTWQTVHSVIYDLDKLNLSVTTQEGSKESSFKMVI